MPIPVRTKSKSSSFGHRADSRLCSLNRVADGVQYRLKRGSGKAESTDEWAPFWPFHD